MLEALFQRWRALGAPIVDSLRPGLPERDMDALVAPLGLRLPTEARVWWGWHDGVETGLLSHGLGNYIVPLRLAEAVEKHRQLLKIAADVTEGDPNFEPGDYWRREWLPFAVPRRADLACDCSVPEDEPSPIRYVEFELPTESQEPVASSLGAVVSLWVEAIDCEAWTYDHSQPDGWVTHPERLSHITGWTRNLIT